MHVVTSPSVGMHRILLSQMLLLRIFCLTKRRFYVRSYYQNKMISFAYLMRNNPYSLKAMFCASGLINFMTDDILVTEGASA